MLTNDRYHFFKEYCIEVKLFIEDFFFYKHAFLGVISLLNFSCYFDAFFVKTHLHLDKNTSSHIFHPDVNVCFLAKSLVIVTKIESIEL